jgi:tRNA pseudouridine55 synthase
MTPARQGQKRQQKKQRNKINGWLVLDKPIGMTSTHAVAIAKRLYNAEKAGHAGTLDPLASGLLPIAFGEATKTVPFVMDGEKAYRFTVRWGIETDSDDADGKPVATSDRRPSAGEIAAILPGFRGRISQVPPKFSALKIDGERAYDLAREGEEVVLEAREVEIHALELVEHAGETSVFEAACGKGTYVRALARDFGRLLGCHGHIAALRRTRVGPFAEADSVSAEDLQGAGDDAMDGSIAARAYLRPVEAGLEELPSIAVSGHETNRLMRGQSIILRGRDAPMIEGSLYATHNGRLVAFGAIEAGEFVPKRVFNLGG